MVVCDENPRSLHGQHLPQALLEGNIKPLSDRLSV
jgi:hypothetical protein